jgi:tripartite ATP-independent transporter DctP family solute receptor
MTSRLRGARWPTALAACAFGLAALLAPGPAAAQTKITAKFSSIVPDNHPIHAGLLRMASLIDARTNGTVEIKIFPSGQLGGELESAEGIKLGSIEGGVITTSVLVNWVPEVQTIDLPFIFRNDDHALASYGLLTSELAPKFQTQGFRVLGMTLSGVRNLIGTFPIRSVEDVKGKKMRVIQSPLHVEIWKLVGSNPTPIPAPEIYSALQTKVVDFMDNPKTNYLSFKWYEVAKNFTELGHIYSVIAFTFSERWWAKLNKEQQAAVQRSVNDVVPLIHHNLSQSDDFALAKTVELGSTVHVIKDREPWRKLMAPIWEDFQKKVPTAKPLVDKIVALKD